MAAWPSPFPPEWPPTGSQPIDYEKFMKKLLVFLILTLCALPLAAGPVENARSHAREAEYYLKKAEGYHREAESYRKKAEGYQRDAEYYTRQGNADKARDYLRKAERAMDDFKTQQRYEHNAEDKAADYFRRAAQALR